jgi:hypothetical protein
MKTDIQNYVDSCEVCQETKTIKQQEPIQSIISQKLLGHIQYDLTSIG